jgi:hypothetical protein
MHQERLRHLAEQLAAGTLSPHDFMLAAAAELAGSANDAAPRVPNPVSSLEAVSLDLDRPRRCGFPEVIYGAGKTAETIVEIAARLLENGQRVLVTRVDMSPAEVMAGQFPQARYNHLARTVRIDPEQIPDQQKPGKQAPENGDQGKWGQVAIISAGTSDRPVAEEALETLDWMGVDTTMIHDVGVAGPHRLPQRLVEFASSDAVVVVAGMEGALPSIVGGYVACPVFAVPTSVGYGASLGGIAALLSMLNSCAANVAVVNIDAGFKAGYLAGLVATRRHGQVPSSE